MKKLSQFEYELIKASWQRNGETEKLKHAEYFEELNSQYRRMSLADIVEQVNNIIKLESQKVSKAKIKR